MFCKMYSTSLNMLAIILALICTSGVNSTSCPCKNPAHCEYQVGHAGLTREVFVFSNGATNVETWRWQTFNTLVVPELFNLNSKEERNTMCVAHENGRKFAVTVKMDLSGALNSKSNEAKSWVESSAKKQVDWFAEYVTVDLLGYFSDDVHSSDEDHKQLAFILSDLKQSLNNHSQHPIEVSCVVPWKPPCSKQKQSTCDFTLPSSDGCDFYIINPDSFLDDSGTDKCRAVATIPFSKLMYGISEYTAHHISFNRIVIGIPWHGYDYECAHFVDDVCMMNTMSVADSSITACNMKRERVTLGNISVLHHDQLEHHQMSNIYNAPYFDYTKNAVRHQVWFEDKNSLGDKYLLAVELNLKGIAVMYGDDLSKLTTRHMLTQKGLMWTWLGHQVLLQKSLSHPHDLHAADTVAGVAVGCLLLGTMMGVVFTCLALKRRVRKPKRPPFIRDGDMGEVDDFTDEDPHL